MEQFVIQSDQKLMTFRPPKQKIKTKTNKQTKQKGDKQANQQTKNWHLKFLNIKMNASGITGCESESM